MKKLISLSAALTVAAGAVSMSAGAAFEHILNSRIWDEEIEMFEAIDNGTINTDINGDGVFDTKDCIIYFAYVEGFTYSDEYTEALEEIGDLDGDGMLFWPDAEHFIRYYMVTHPLTLSDFDAETYADYEIKYQTEDKDFFSHEVYVTDHSMVDNFLMEMRLESSCLMAGYDMYCEYVDNGTLDPDLNADGKCDLTDLTYFWVYSMDREVFTIDSPHETSMDELDQDIFDRAAALYNTIPDTDTVGECIFNFANMYYFEHGNVTKDMITNEFFESVVRGSSELELEKLVRSEYFFLVPQNDPYIDFDGKMFNREYRAYVQAVKDGEKSIPDTNGDGILNSLDAFNIYIYTEELKRDVTAENSILPDDIYSIFRNDMDVNGNGLSGDMNDLTIIDLYVCIEDKGIEEMDEVCDNFTDRLNEYAAQLTAAKNMPPVKFSPDGEYIPMLFASEVERTGDSNNDGTTDLADAIFIMQSLANPDKYQLSPLGKFNADVDETGGGITSNDALTIQNRLLGLE